jgi:AraC-like DNA-binding protein
MHHPYIEKLKLLYLKYVIFIAVAISMPCIAAYGKNDDDVHTASKGDIAFQAGYASNALEYYTEELDQAEKADDDLQYTRCLGKIGNVYSFTGDEQRAISYYLDGYQAAEKMGNETLQFNFASALVGSYCNLEDTEKAELFFKEQRQLAHEQTDLKQFYLLYNQGRIANAKKEYLMSTFYMQKAADFARERELEPNIIYAPYMMMTDIALSQKQYDEAKKYLDQAEIYARKSMGEYPISRVYRSRASYFEGLNMPDSAKKYSLLYREIEDSLFNQNQFYVAHNKLFDHENSINKRKINRLISKNNMLIIIIIIAVTLLTVISILLAMLRRRNIRLKDAYSTLLDKIQAQIKSDTEIADEEPADEIAEPEVKAEDSESQDGKRITISLDSENYKVLRHRISKALSDLEVISNPDLTLALLADKIGSNSTYVSQIINSVYGKSFRQLLNELRIREACRRMSDTEHYGNLTLQTIYESVGFNSAASFIQAFKKENGMTPSTYQKMLRTRKPDPA